MKTELFKATVNEKEHMKLYTEEQLLNTIEAIREYLKNYPEKFHESMIEKHLKNLAPIELPSDEEIDKEQAKAMHKEEIMDARTNGRWSCTEKYGEVRTNIQYYNETFGDNNEQD